MSRVAPAPELAVMSAAGCVQVILVRTTESIERLPKEIRYSNAIILTVPQVSKPVGVGVLSMHVHMAGHPKQRLILLCTTCH